MPRYSALAISSILCLFCTPKIAGEGDDFVVSQGTLVKGHEDCDLWADRDGECLHNPNFMWTKCHSSCIEYARDLQERCSQWADEGECTHNPRFIHLNCPESCGLAVSWSPFVRRTLHMDPLPVIKELQQDVCTVPQDILSAAHMMKHRLRGIIFFGGARSVPGFTYDAPSEYLGMLGLAEAFLYTMRLYSVCMDAAEHQIVAHFATHQHETETTANEARRSMASIQDVHADNLRTVYDTVQRADYQSDLLMRSLPRWMTFLDTAAEATLGALRVVDKSVPALTAYDPCGRVGPALSILPAPTYWERLGMGEHQEGNTIGGRELLEESRRDLLLRGAGRGAGAAAGADRSEAGSTGKGSVAPTDVSTTVKLSNGVHMPVLGLGTWQLDGEVCETAVYEAIKLGYRHIDTAEAYRNEAQVGWAVQRAIKEGLVTREELFIATKLSDESHAGYATTTAFVKEQLKLLQVDYVDLYMLHSPLSMQVSEKTNTSPQGETWRALQDLLDVGLVRAIGVSNFDAYELRLLIEHPDTRHPPSVVQNKIDPYHVGKQLDNRGDGIVEYARSKGVQLVAYSPFSAYPFAMLAPLDPLILHVAKAYSDHHRLSTPATGAQIILRWALQKGFAPIPRSSTLANLKANLDTLSLPPLPPILLAMVDSLQFLVTSSVSLAVAVEG